VKDDISVRRCDQFVPLEQTRLSTQCGFSSTVEGNSLSFDEEVAKLQLVVKSLTSVGLRVCPLLE